MTHRNWTALLLAACALTACGKGDDSPAKVEGPVVATVNGEPITQSQFDLYLDTISRQSGRAVPEEQKSEVLDQLISLHLAADAAEKSGAAKQTKIQDQLTVTRVNVLADAALQKFMEEHPVQDAELKPEYDAQVAAMPREYHARHILVEDKQTADAITKQLQSGGDFAKLAAQKSKDTSTAPNGGDLDWFTLDSMVKPFGDAVAKLQPGQLTAEPVQTQYGWHVIKLEDSRAAAPPPFEEVKDRVRIMVQRKRLQSYLDELRKGAKIEKHLQPAAAAAQTSATQEPNS